MVKPYAICLLAFAGLALSACSETPQETAKDVAIAEAKAQEKMADTRQAGKEDLKQAREELAETAGDAMTEVGKAADNYHETAANTRYDQEMARIEGEYAVGKEKCDGMEGDAADRCKTLTDERYESAKSAAEAALEKAQADS